ncbi:MAG TPA: 1-acyl-sn-glycerol-3-phosphate acyltransferase [Candidatus Binatia bacterium]|nr:1-acyl-sn-glycerol-3-phosphate acyltransferase [Candidatus Binatia bacterium]
MSAFRAAARASALVLWTGLLAAALACSAAAALVSKAAAARLGVAAFRLWARGAARVIGLRIERSGVPPRPPFFLVANHLTYLDVVVLASTLEATFVAKADVARWPGVGRLCRALGTVFVDRTRKRDLLRVLPQLEALLGRGTGVVVFPEGTTTAGDRVLDFRSSLFAAAERTGAPVRVAALTYATPGGSPSAARAVCWWGDMTFVPHLLALLRLPSCTARVEFAAAPVAGSRRKDLARAAHAAVVRRFVPIAEGETGPMPFDALPASANIRVLRDGAELLRRIDDGVFRSSVGPQLRHCLDFYGAFLRGLAVRRVDYDTRERDPLVESSRRIAGQRYDEVIAALARITPAESAARIDVRSEGDTLPPGAPEWCASSVRRELQFLLSHTVHHHALVKEMLRARGRTLGAEFGVAPSTLAHRGRFACAR